MHTDPLPMPPAMPSCSWPLALPFLIPCFPLWLSVPSCSALLFPAPPARLPPPTFPSSPPHIACQHSCSSALPSPSILPSLCRKTLGLTFSLFARAPFLGIMAPYTSPFFAHFHFAPRCLLLPVHTRTRPRARARTPASGRVDAIFTRSTATPGTPSLHFHHASCAFPCLPDTTTRPHPSSRQGLRTGGVVAGSG